MLGTRFELRLSGSFPVEAHTRHVFHHQYWSDLVMAFIPASKRVDETFYGRVVPAYVSARRAIVESFARELTAEEEARMMDRIASEVIKRRLETVAIMFLESIKPMSYVGSQLAMVFVGPFLAVFGDLGINYIKFFDKRENVEKLLQKIEEQTKIRDEEEKKAKEDGKLISNRFRFRLDLLPGFSLREDVTRCEESSGILGISRKESDGGGFVAICFEAAESSPPNLLEAISAHFEREDLRQALVLSQDTILRMVKSDGIKIRGHQACAVTYEWREPAGRNGIAESYGLWCNKTRRLLILSMKTGPLSGAKVEKDQIRDLRIVFGSLKCH